MSVVYCGHDRELGRPVAVKLLPEHLADDAESRGRFLREARLAARLIHPNVVAVYDLGEHGSRLFIVMEYVDGEPLSALLARGALPAGEAVELLLQACAGVAEAHGRGLVHRDLKPANLLLSADGTLKVSDFGLARAADGTALTEPGTILGTAAYLPPEQARGEPPSAAGDVYSLGVLAYELLSGRVPYRFASLADLAQVDRLPPPPPLRSVPPGVEAAVLHALARDPAARPQTAADLRQELGTSTVALPGRAPAQQRRQRPALLLAAAVLVVVALVAAAVVGRGGRAQRPAPAPAAGVTQGATPAADARNLARWLRAHSK
jgi:serine/threonine-protein kinase